MISFLDVLGRMCINGSFFDGVNSGPNHQRPATGLNSRELRDYFLASTPKAILSRYEIASIHIFLEKEAGNGEPQIPGGRIAALRDAWNASQPKKFASAHFYKIIGACCIDEDYLTKAMAGNFAPFDVDADEATGSDRLQDKISTVQAELRQVDLYWIPPTQQDRGGKCASAITHSLKFKMPTHSH